MNEEHIHDSIRLGRPEENLNCPPYRRGHLAFHWRHPPRRSNRIASAHVFRLILDLRLCLMVPRKGSGEKAAVLEVITPFDSLSNY